MSCDETACFLLVNNDFLRCTLIHVAKKRYFAKNSKIQQSTVQSDTNHAVLSFLVRRILVIFSIVKCKSAL